MHYNINQQTQTDRAPYFLPALSNIPIFLPGSNLPARTNPATCRRQQAGTPKSAGPLCQRQPQTKSGYFPYREHARSLFPRRSLPSATPTHHRQHGDPLLDEESHPHATPPLSLFPPATQGGTGPRTSESRLPHSPN